MSRISDIILRARDSLADPNQERWTDDRLVRLLDEAQKTIARRFELLRAQTNLTIEINRAIYPLPDNLWRITRATFNDKVIPLLSYEKLDEKDLCWQTATGSEIKALVYNHRNLTECRIYPRPDEDFPLDPANFLNIFGVTTSIDSVPADPLYGVLTNIADEPFINSQFNSVYGVFTDSIETQAVTIFYIKDPETIQPGYEALGQELEIAPMFDTVLKFYVIGHAYMDDLDTQYQQKGAAALSLYEREVELLGARAKVYDGTRAAQYETSYRSGF